MHELALLASATLLENLIAEESTVYPALARAGKELRDGLRTVASEAGLAVSLLGTPEPVGAQLSKMRD